MAELLSIELAALTAWFEECRTGADEFTSLTAPHFARRLAAATERARLMEAAVVFLDARGGGPNVPSLAPSPDAGFPHAGGPIAGGRRAHVIPIGGRPAGTATDAARKAPAWTPRLIPGGLAAELSTNGGEAEEPSTDGGIGGGTS
ncbi:MAG: hypothetical protein JNK56_39475 [Myxococcales bacterium]|nr:hypothetical protein [Myxococcales bacterium]